MDLWRHFAMAWDRMKERAYFVLFLVYPAVCRRSFSIFNCRRLGEQLSVLIDDYDLLCMVCQTWRDTAPAPHAPYRTARPTPPACRNESGAPTKRASFGPPAVVTAEKAT